MVRVAQPCGYTQCHLNVQLNMVKIICFRLCDFCHNKIFFQRKISYLKKRHNFQMTPVSP